MTKSKQLKEKLTKKLIELIENTNDEMKWEKMWSGLGLNQNFNNLSKENKIEVTTTYSGINQMLLSLESMANNFESNYWITYNKAKSLKLYIKKTEIKKYSMIYFNKPIKKQIEIEKEDGTTETSNKIYWCLKTYRVYNASQLEDWEKLKKYNLETKEFSEINVAETLLKNSGADIKFAPGGAYYSPSEDYISLPPKNSFETEESFYATAFHELSHWTGNKKRLNRKGVAEATSRFGNKKYSEEELVAEMSAGMICNHLGIKNDLTNMALYLKSWLKALKENATHLFSVHTQSFKAFDYIINLKGKEE